MEVDHWRLKWEDQACPYEGGIPPIYIDYLERGPWKLLKTYQTVKGPGLQQKPVDYCMRYKNWGGLLVGTLYDSVGWKGERFSREELETRWGMWNKMLGNIRAACCFWGVIKHGRTHQLTPFQ